MIVIKLVRVLTSLNSYNNSQLGNIHMITILIFYIPEKYYLKDLQIFPKISPHVTSKSQRKCRYCHSHLINSRVRHVVNTATHTHTQKQQIWGCTLTEYH